MAALPPPPPVSLTRRWPASVPASSLSEPMNVAKVTPALVAASQSALVSRFMIGIFLRATGTSGVMTFVALFGTTPKQL